MPKFYETKSNYVFDSIKQRILNNEYIEGESLVITKLTEDFGVSAIPIREAISRLESEGLVVVLPHKGATVKVVDKKHIEKIIEVRGVLEAYATKLAIDFLDSATINELKVLAEKINNCAIKKDDKEFYKYNEVFHRIIYSNSQNDILINSIYEMWDGGRWSKTVFANNPEEMLVSAKEHFNIIDCLENKRYNDIEDVAREHKNKNIILLKNKG